MNRRNMDDLIRDHLDGELGDEERRILVDRLLADPASRREAREMEAVDALLLELGEEGPEAPTDLTSEVMARVRESTAPARPWWRRLADEIGSSPMRLLAAGGVTLVAGLLLGLGAAKIATLDPSLPLEVRDQAGAQQHGAALHAAERDAGGAVRVHFVLRAPDAREVSVVGDFNRWDPHAHPLERAGDVWRGVVPLPRGRYEYQFVVDGEVWIVDPAADGTVDDGFGGLNGVLEV